MTTRPGSGRRHLATSPFEPQPTPVIETFVVGDQVSHDTYGLGRVIGTDAHTTTVDFNPRKIRVSSPYIKMRKL